MFVRTKTFHLHLIIGEGHEEVSFRIIHAGIARFGSSPGDLTPESCTTLNVREWYIMDGGSDYGKGTISCGADHPDASRGGS